MWLTTAVAGAVFALDRLAKALTIRRLALGARTVPLPGVLELWHTRNQGVAFGLLSRQSALALLLPLLAVGALLLLLRKSERTRLLAVAQGLIVGGFLGNFIDRLLSGAVTDMIFLPWLPLFVCNVADVAVCAGVAALAVALLLKPTGGKEARRGDDG